MATMRYNDLNYSGSVHKWVKQPVPVGAAAPQGQLHLPKWVRTGACARGAACTGAKRHLALTTQNE